MGPGTLTGDVADTANETVLIEDWYQFFPSHSIGTLLFGADGYLYVGGGEGASYNWADWGQGVGNPAYPDERSPTVSGVPEGGALRSLGLEVESRYANQEVWLDDPHARGRAFLKRYNRAFDRL